MSNLSETDQRYLQHAQGYLELGMYMDASNELENIALRDGFQSLALDAAQKVKDGLVSFDDIYPILLENSI